MTQPCTEAEVEAVLGLIGGARHVVVGTAADPVSRANGARIAAQPGAGRCSRP